MGGLGAGRCRRATAIPFPRAGHRRCSETPGARARMCIHTGVFTAGACAAQKAGGAAHRRVRRGFARMARSVYAMARAVRARAWPCSRVLADRRERDRVQLRGACVQHDLCKGSAHLQSWQHFVPHGARRACAPGEAQPVSLILRACALESGRRGLRRPGQRAGAQRALGFHWPWIWGGNFLAAMV